MLGFPAVALSQAGDAERAFDAAELGPLHRPPRAAARLGCAPARRRHQRQRPGGRGGGRARGAPRAAAGTGPSCGRPERPRAVGATTASTAPGRCGWKASPGTDIAAVADGCISLTPLRFDLFADDALAALSALLPEAG